MNLVSVIPSSSVSPYGLRLLPDCVRAPSNIDTYVHFARARPSLDCIAQLKDAPQGP